MMMPANFSVMAENELVYVVGGSAVTDWAKTFNTNLVTMVGNSFVKRLVNTTLGTMFGGMWGDNGSLIDNFSNAFFPDGQSGLNTVMSAVGVGAAVYQLGTAATGSLVENPGKTEYKKDTPIEGTDLVIKKGKYTNFFGTKGLFYIPKLK